MPLPLPVPLSLFRDGLLALLNKDDKPRGLFGLFGREDDAPSTEEEANREARARWATDPVFQDARVEELRNLFGPSDPQEWDPETLAYFRRMNAAGDIASASAATATRYGPWAFMWPGGPTRFGPGGPGGRSTTSAPQYGPGFVLGAPQAKPAESQAYSVPRRDDAEAAPQPGSAFLFGGPQAKTAEDTEDQVYHLPPPEDAWEESSEEEAERKAQEERAAAKAKENWEAWCDRRWTKEKQRCDYKFSYEDSELAKCQDRAYKRYKSCLKNDDEEVGQWTDTLANGGFKQKTPYQKRLQKWKRPREKPG